MITGRATLLNGELRLERNTTAGSKYRDVGGLASVDVHVIRHRAQLRLEHCITERGLLIVGVHQAVCRLLAHALKQRESLYEQGVEHWLQVLANKCSTAAGIKQLSDLWVGNCQGVKHLGRSLLTILAGSLDVEHLGDLGAAHLLESLAQFALKGGTLVCVKCLYSRIGILTDDRRGVGKSLKALLQILQLFLNLTHDLFPSFSPALRERAGYMDAAM